MMTATEHATGAPALARDEEEMLLYLYGAEQAMRGDAPSGDRGYAIIDRFVREHLAERKELAGTRTVTARGCEVAQTIVEHRKTEQQGLPIEAWRKECDPEGLSLAEFRGACTHKVDAQDGFAYVTNGHAAVRVEGTYPGTAQPAPHLETVFEHELWTHTPTAPVAYQFRRRHSGRRLPPDDLGRNQSAVVAFDLDGLFVAARYYEVALEAAGGRARWVAMRARRGNPHHDGERRRRKRWQVVRADTPEATGVAYVAPYLATTTPPEIKALIAAARGTGR